LGFGTVGRGVYQMLRDNGEEIARKVGCPLEIVRIGIRDPKKPRSLPAQLFTSDIESILNDPTIHVIAEVIGGLDPAGSYVEKALRRGKHVVTAKRARDSSTWLRRVNSTSITRPRSVEAFLSCSR
jgi:homoserine dehydrogenase